MRRFIGIAAICFTMTTAAQKENTGSFTTEVVQKVNIGYLLHSPANTSSKKPLIVFLHGSGEKGTDTEKLKANGPLKYVKNHAIDAYILAPQCRQNEFWNEESVYQLVQKIVSENNIDANRIYLTGLSLGGFGTLKLGMAHPEMFAALVPVCGFFDRNDREKICNIKNVPTRIYHGLLDDVVSPDYAAELYKRLRACHAKAELTIFESANHNSWDQVYDNPEIYDWMLSQSKK
jgi:predicted peptidase